MCGQAGGTEEGRGKEKEGKAKRRPQVNLTLVSFAVTRKAYERITQRFAKEYEAATGQPVRFRLSFGGSGTQVFSIKFFWLPIKTSKQPIHMLNSPSVADDCGCPLPYCCSLL